jgi:hypothetical protein
MKIFLLISLLTISSMNAMDAKWKAQIAQETRWVKVLRSFQNEEFIKTALSKEHVQEILKQLEGLQSTSGDSLFINQALLALAKKSELHGNLKQEILIAQRLINAGADIEFSQTNIIPLGRSSQMGHPTIIRTETVFASARGDLKEFLEVEWAENSRN